MDYSNIPTDEPDLIQPEKPGETTEEAIERLVAMPEMEYEQKRTDEAKALGVRAGKLDSWVKQTRPVVANDQQGQPLHLEPPDPWDAPVDPVATLDEVQNILARFVVADAPTLQAATLWCVFTHFINVVKVAPIANITAPEKNCGKSTMLRCLYLLSRCPIKADNITASAIFRVIDRHQPTLFIDEVDAFLKANEAARSILNSGHEPDGYVYRNVGDNHEPHKFRTYGAKALCGIGSIQSTLESRAIRLELRRKLPDEKTENVRFSDPDQWCVLQRKLARLAEDLSEPVSCRGEISVAGLNNRAADNWQPLVAIADAVGGHWPNTARQAASRLEQLEPEAPEVGAELLADVKAVFDHREQPQIFTQDLLDALIQDKESPWLTYNRDRPLTMRQLAVMLKPYGGKPRSIRIGRRTQKGYRKADFEEAFKRYLHNPPVQSVTPSHPWHDKGSSDPESVTPITSVTARKSSEPLRPRGCDVVTGQTSLAADDDEEVF